jgi:hypothetical protein
MTKLYDLHLEVEILPNGEYLARTIYGNNSIKFEGTANNQCDAICNMIVDLDVCGGLDLLQVNPALSVFPLGAPVGASQKAPTSGTKTVAANSNKNKPKKKPSELMSVSNPDCQPLCTSYDLFGAVKCKSMCGHRSGL